MKRSEWSNGAEWGEIFCPMTGKDEMTYWKKGKHPEQMDV